jgi:hypothetical protein
MKTRSLAAALASISLVGLAVVLAFRGASAANSAAVTAAASAARPQHPAAPAQQPAAPLADRTLPDYQRGLIDMAFQAASRLPLDPHVKTRSRLQEDVLEAALQLDQPVTVRRLSPGIANWRRGTVLAELAFYSVQHGDRRDVEDDLHHADQIAEQVGMDKNAQDWPRDRIRIAIARTYELLGRKEKVAEFSTGAPDFEAGKLAVLQASRIEPEQFEAQLASMDQILHGAGFEQWKMALGACARLYDRFYADKARRESLEDRIVNGCPKLPAQLRLDFVLEIAGYALAHGDNVKALFLVEQGRHLVASVQWLPQDHVPLLARLASLSAAAGAKEPARRDLAQAIGVYEGAKPPIVDVFRARALRPVAEAYVALGDRAAALDMYRRVVAESIVNPNSRPRAEDFCATCLSLAVHAIEPDEALRQSLLDVLRGLGDPW